VEQIDLREEDEKAVLFEKINEQQKTIKQGIKGQTQIDNFIEGKKGINSMKIKHMPLNPLAIQDLMLIANAQMFSSINPQQSNNLYMMGQS